jgi:transposase
VLNVPGKKATTKSYLWVRVGGIENQKVVLFDFGPSRGSEVALRLVKGFQGFIHTDGYDSAYDKVEEVEGIIRVQCWMHVRRTFKTALKVLGKPGKGGICDQAIARIKALYQIEKDAASLSPEQRFVLRQEKRNRSWMTLKFGSTNRPI